MTQALSGNLLWPHVHVASSEGQRHAEVAYRRGLRMETTSFIRTSTGMCCFMLAITLNFPYASQFLWILLHNSFYIVSLQSVPCKSAISNLDVDKEMPATVSGHDFLFRACLQLPKPH